MATLNLSLVNELFPFSDVIYKISNDYSFIAPNADLSCKFLVRKVSQLCQILFAYTFVTLLMTHAMNLGLVQSGIEPVYQSALLKLTQCFSLLLAFVNGFIRYLDKKSFTSYANIHNLGNLLSFL